MSTISFQLQSIQIKNKNGFETYFPYHTIFSLIGGFHLGRHLGYIEMLNDSKWHHSDFSRTMYVLPESTKKKKHFKIKFQVLVKFAQILPDYRPRGLVFGIYVLSSEFATGKHSNLHA